MKCKVSFGEYGLDSWEVPGSLGLQKRRLSGQPGGYAGLPRMSTHSCQPHSSHVARVEEGSGFTHRGEKGYLESIRCPLCLRAQGFSMIGGLCIKITMEQTRRDQKNLMTSRASQG